jgi:hypothetical protein
MSYDFQKVDAGYFVPSKEILKELSYPVEGNENCFAIEENSRWFNVRKRYTSKIMIFEIK